jgi:hypothetical protein
LGFVAAAEELICRKPAELTFEARKLERRILAQFCFQPEFLFFAFLLTQQSKIKTSLGSVPYQIF